MSEPQEFSGRTIEEAIAEGLKTLQRERHEVEIEVVQHPRRKFLGRVDAVVSMQPADEVPEDLEEEAAPQRTVTGQPEPEAAAPETPEATPAAPPALAEAAVPAEDADAEAASAAVPEGYAEAEQVAVATLTQLLNCMDLSAYTINRTWATDARDRPILTLQVEGERLGRLIGKRGATLFSLQSILRLMLGQNADHRPYVNLDIDGYQLKQQQALTQTAHKIAAEVVARGRPYEMEPLPAVNRRIVHLALQDHPDVYTESEGSGPDRRVVIYLK